jgi:peroxiredoxin
MLRSGLRYAAVLAAAAAFAATLDPSPATVTASPAVADAPPTLAIGVPAPDFSLPGIDGKTYTLASFKDAKALVVVFTAVHCPTAQVYEERLKKLVADYAKKGVAFAMIQPNNAKAVRLDEMGYTDLGDSLEDMKVRAEHRSFNFPFLYDGETQATSTKYGPVATPHVFVFDKDRKLRYQGRIDNSPREAFVKVLDARLALDAVLSGGAVPLEKTPTVGCSIKWLSKVTSASSEQEAIKKEPVPLEKVDAAGLEALVENAGSGKTRLINFWATWCAPCTAEFPDLQATWRMYKKRPFELVTVAINYPDEEPGVRKFLDAQHATTKNLLFGTNDPYALMKVVDADWNGAVPYSMIVAPGGKVLFRGGGVLDMLQARRTILASFPDDDYVGQNAYWNSK